MLVVMHTTTPTITQLIEDATYWRTDASGVMAVVQGRPREAETLYRVDEDDLRTYHALLPEVILALIRHNAFLNENTEKQSQASGILVRESVHLLRNPKISLHDNEGVLRTPVMVDYVRCHHGRVHIKGIFASLHESMVNAKAVTVVIGGIQGVIEIPFKKLEAQFPGWSSRLGVGESMDMGPDELLRYVLTSNPANEVRVQLPEQWM